MTPKDHIDLLFELTYWLPTFGVRKHTIRRQSYCDEFKKKFSKLYKKVDMFNPLVEMYLKDKNYFYYKSLSIVGTKETYGINSSIEEYELFSEERELMESKKQPKYFYKIPLYNYLFINGGLKSYINSRTKKQFGIDDYNNLLIADKESKTRLVFMEDSGYLKALKTLGYILNDGLMTFIDYRTKSNKNKKD